MKHALKSFFTFFIVISFILGFLLYVPRTTSAATDVWDGTINTSFSGSGTEEDPYLAENASQLAGVASVVNNDSAGAYYELSYSALSYARQ